MDFSRMADRDHREWKAAEPRTHTGQMMLRGHKGAEREAWRLDILAIEAEATAHADAQASLARLDLAEAAAAPGLTSASAEADGLRAALLDRLFALHRWEAQGDGFFADAIWLNDAIEAVDAALAAAPDAEGEQP